MNVLWNMFMTIFKTHFLDSFCAFLMWVTTPKGKPIDQRSLN